MFSHHVASSVLPASISMRSGESYEAGRGGKQGEEPFYFIAGRDEKTDEIILKIVNANDYTVNASIEIKGETIAPHGTKLSLQADMVVENSFAMPAAVLPKEQAVDGLSNKFKLELGQQSITIFRLKNLP
ncbi:alpha-L-arabinofuranosidase C-terminal domain-containing protein [Paenibacillus sp. FSL A5-0031]|uniref:alpha-L-arabinofuranosidase C-terminal domain-containing protein n=1 Tax=Paenibacillus sp. FSL A5-0031 TaxID=1920420 RepID=UPI00211672B3|nr:alpha-L-arabinofuranosidase C-terminal domain-containing protein [Paenibacillus sp. FSL A5-0031]